MSRYWVLRNSAAYRKDNEDYVMRGTKKEAEKLAAALNTAGARVWVEEVTA